MIPDFKTYIKESIWSDMQERGTGDIIKTEDITSINNMNKDQFYDFLCDRYKQISGENWFIGCFESAISFPVFGTKDDNEGFSVFIISAFIITDIVFTEAGWNALLRTHGIVRQRYRDSFSGAAERAAGPSLIKVQTFHRRSSFFCSDYKHL